MRRKLLEDNRSWIIKIFRKVNFLTRNYYERFTIMKTLILIMLAITSFSKITAGEKPLQRIAIIGPTHITALPANKIIDLNGKTARAWLKEGAKKNLKETIKVIHQLKPDALVINGSLTWTGSEADYKLLLSYLKEIEIPYYLTAGDRDLQCDPDLKIVKKIFGEHYVGGNSLKFEGINFLFPEPALREKGYKLPIEWLGREIAEYTPDENIILVDGSNINKYAEGTMKTQYQKYLKDKRMLCLVESNNSFSINATQNTPIWAPPAPGWSPGGGVGLVEIYSDKVILKNIFEVGQPPMTLMLSRSKDETSSTIKKDTYPQYTDVLAQKPELTIVQISDPQINYKKIKSDEKQFLRAVKEVNVLKPEYIFITGDLVHYNIEAEWDSYRKVADKIKSKKYILPGNHDVLHLYDAFIEPAYRDSAKKHPKEAQGTHELAEKVKQGGGGDSLLRIFYKFTGEERDRFTVEDKGCAFICIPTYTVQIDKDVLEWLESELERTKDFKHVFVLTHYPVLPRLGYNVRPERGGSKFLDLMKKYKVAAVLNGHRHRFDYYYQDGTMHMVCDRPYSQYLVYHIFPEKIIVGIKYVGRDIFQYLEFPEPRQ